MKQWILLCLSVTGAAVAEPKPYTIADLKALVQQKAYREAIDHFDDVAPADRNADWTAALGQAAAGAVASGSDDIEALVTALQIEKRYPAVLKASAYVAVRTDIGPKGFEACFRDRYDAQVCRDYALRFVDDDATNGKLALAIAKVARHNMFSHLAIPFFTRAIAASGAAICKDPDLEVAVIAGLGLDTNDALFTGARAIAATTCWSDLQKPIIKGLAGEGDTYVDNACALLKAKKQAAKECK